VNRKYYGLILVVGLVDAIAAFALITLGGAGARALLVVPLVLAVPGYAITMALFPGRALRLVERIVLSLGLSLAVVALGGLALQLTPFGLRPVPWVVLLGTVMLIAGGVAAARWRRQRQPGEVAPAYAGLTGAQALLCLLAVVILAGATALTVQGARGQATVGFTQLWMVQASPTDPTTLRLGVSNQEPATTDYRLQFEVEGTLLRTWSMQIAPGETWEESVPLPPQLPQSARIEAVLYRADTPGTVYRRVQLWRGAQ
jgi:uncharacterized membrane protein